jgi:hypothetical protein
MRECTNGNDLVRVCTQCGAPRPITWFRFHHRNAAIRHSECRACNNRAARERRARKRRKAAHGFAQQVNRNWENVPRLAMLATEMLSRFGGASGFAEVWHEAISQAQKEGRHHLTIRSMIATLHVVSAAQQLTDAKESGLGLLSDTELEKAQLQAVVDLVHEQPMLAVEAAWALGWKVIPPNSDVRSAS